MRQLIRRAMGDPDCTVIVFEYEDKKGNRTRRVVSPIRFFKANSFLALCLCREEPRMFQMDRCTNLVIQPAHEFAMPVPIAAVG